MHYQLLLWNDNYKSEEKREKREEKCFQSQNKLIARKYTTFKIKNNRDKQNSEASYERFGRTISEIWIQERCRKSSSWITNK